MQTTSEPSSAAPIHASRRRRITQFFPAAVIVGTLALIANAAWPLIHPAREVRVVQAVFDRSAAVIIPAADESAESTERPRSTKAVQAPGWLEAEPFYVAATALADGIVESIEVLEGDRVEEGQAVARLVDEDAELALRRVEGVLDRTRANLETARAELAAAQTEWDEPFELERAIEVAQSDIAEQQAELERLPAIIESKRAQLVHAEEELKRSEQSRRSDAVAELELIAIRQRTKSLRSEVEALEREKPLIEARLSRARAQLRAAEQDLDLRIEQRRRLDAAHANVSLAEAEVGEAEAARDIAALELERMIVRAPITGYVQRRLKVPGDKAIRMMDSPHSAHIVHLYDPNSLQVRVDVPLADASHIFVGQRCEVIVEVLPDRTFAGEVIRITHEADLQKNTLQAKVRVIDPDPVLRPEMLTRVKFLPDTERGASSTTSESSVDEAKRASTVFVPSSAIDGSGERVRIWLVSDRNDRRGVLTPIDVTLIDRSEGWATVRGPLSPGMLLAVVQDSQFSPGEAARIIGVADSDVIASQGGAS